MSGGFVKHLHVVRALVRPPGIDVTGYATGIGVVAGCWIVLLSGACGISKPGVGASSMGGASAETGGQGGQVPSSSGGCPGAGPGGVGAASSGDAPPFSFFVTSLQAMRDLSGSADGFGGDLRFGETGDGAGLRGADKICRTIADRALPGSGAKTWRAFLSTTTGSADGGPVDAIDRVGAGPWYDRFGRLVAANRSDLAMDRPCGADPAIVDDLPNEDGVPNHRADAPTCVGANCPDNHDTLTGTGSNGRLYKADAQYTCDDWTSAAPTGRPRCGHSWPFQDSGTNWMSSLNEGGCAPGVNLITAGGPMTGVRTVGTGGGYGGIYCFALSP